MLQGMAKHSQVIKRRYEQKRRLVGDRIVCGGEIVIFQVRTGLNLEFSLTDFGRVEPRKMLVKKVGSVYLNRPPVFESQRIHAL